MTNNGGITTGGSRESTSVTNLFFDVANNSTFGDSVDGKNVTDGDLSLQTAVNVLTGILTFSGDEVFFVSLVSVGISESNFS